MAPKETAFPVDDGEPATAELVAKLSVAANAMRQYANLADSLARIVTKNPHDVELAEAIQESLVKVKPARKRKLAVATSNEEEAGTKKRKRERKPKDPNAPKRPASAYLIFQNGIRSTLKAAHPDLQQKDLLKMISQQWAAMSDKDKAPYFSQVTEAKEKFETDKAAYDARDVDVESPATETSAPPPKAKKASTKQATEEPAPKTAKKPTSKPGPKSAAIIESSDSSPEADEESESGSSSEEEEAPAKPKVASSDDSEDSESESEPEVEPPKKKGKTSGRSR